MAKNAYQPLPVALFAIQVQYLNGNRLSSQTRPKFVINEPFIDRSKPTFTKKITLWEVLCNNLELLKSKNMKIWSNKRDW